ncbi:MAG: hypothetical protein OEY00_04945 [Gammaproteobacteria bacterium]|nr:hypothetical protein [Gammaproteobacteria bacterium]
MTGNLANKNISSLIVSSNPNVTYLVWGMSLLALFAAQLLLGLRWEWLAQLQQGEVYRQFTGYLLLSYVLIQARLGLKRVKNQTTNLVKEFDMHKIQGVFGPLVFYIHSIEVGYAYQLLLAIVFLGNCIIGYFSPHALQWKNKVYLLSWTITHVSLAVLTLFLMIFHIYVVYQYS